MTDAPKNFERVIPQLRHSLRRWRGRAFASFVLILLSAGVIYACWRSDDLQWEWYVLGGLGVVINSVRLSSEIHEYKKTQRRIETMESLMADGPT